MHRISAGLATCLVAAVTVGCGTAQAGQPGSQGHTNAPATAGSPGQQPGSRLASGCQGAGPDGSAAQTLVITLAGNGKTYCRGLIVTSTRPALAAAIWIKSHSGTFAAQTAM